MQFIKQLLLFLGFFILVFGPPYKGIPWLDLSLIFAAATVGIGILSGTPIPAKIFKFCIPLILLSVYILVTRFFEQRVSMVELANDILKPVKVGLVLLASYYLVLLAKKVYNHNVVEAVILNLLLVITLHAVIMITQFFQPEFKDTIYRYTSGGEVRSTFDYALRMGGLSGGVGGAVLSIVMSLGIMLIPFLWRNGLKWLLVISGLLIFFSIQICGRSGLWSLIIFLPLASFFATSNKKKFFKGFFVTAIIVLLISGSFFAYIASNAHFTKGEELGFVNALSRTFDTFLYASERADTQEAFGEMVAFPKDLKTVVLGEPYYLIDGNNRRELNSDMGYIRGIWSYGILGLSLFLFPFIKILTSGFAIKNISQKKIYTVLCIIIIISLSFHVKELFLYTRMIFPFTAVLISLYFSKLNNAENYLKNLPSLPTRS